MAKFRPNTSRLFALTAVIVLSIFCVDGIRRNFTYSDDIADNSITVRGRFRNEGEEPVLKKDDSFNLGNGYQIAENSVPDTVGFTEISIPSIQMSSGILAVIDENRKGIPAGDESMVELINVKNGYYTLADSTIKLETETSDALNSMMEGYYDATGLSDFIVYGTTDTYAGEGSCCPEKFNESVAGNTIDLAVKGSCSVLGYDGLDEQSWLIENCYKYGFIVRYPEGKSDMTGSEYCPWHIRYVGRLNAMIMKERKYCLEEYLNFLRGFTFDYPFVYNFDGLVYQIYSVESMGDATSARVPVSGNYTISGTNLGHYIITAVKS